MTEITGPLTDQQLDEIQARQRIADQILPIIYATNVSRTACLTEPADAIPQITVRRIADNISGWIASGDWVDRPLTEAEFDAAERASTSALAAEVRRLRALLAAVSSAPADRAALRDRIAQAIGDFMGAICSSDFDLADAVLAVLPASADRAAVLQEAAEVAVRAARSCGDSETGQYAASVAAGISKELRRVAAETPHPEAQPCRGDAFEQWLKAQRDEYHQTRSPQWLALDEALDTYRLHADTGTPLGGHVCEGRAVCGSECLERPATEEPTP